MGIEFIAPDVDELTPKIAVIGVGGAGGNAIANMMRADVQGVEFLVANTDAQALKQSIAPQKIQLGAKITQGLGAGSRPEIGRAAAEETIEQVAKLLEGAHMCFIAAGMGGGTGTGAAPVIAKAARDMGILTVGVVTKPFAFEGKRRGKSADQGIEELQKFVDTLIVIPNQNLFLIANPNTTFKEAFQMADEVLQQGVRSITDLMIMPGLINLDFADVRSVMGEMGKAMMGTGEGEGPNRALEAAERAIANPLLDGVSMQGAKGVIISIIGGDDMKLLEVDEAANHIRELVDPDANIIWGSAFNPDLQGKIRVSVVATGIEQTTEMAEIASRPLNLGASRGPVRPAVQAPASSTFQAAPAAPVQPPVQSQPAPYAAAAEPYEPTTELELGAADEAREEPAPAVFGGLRGGFSEPLELGLDEQAEPAPAPAPAPAPTPAPAAPRPRMQDELRLDGGQQVPASQPVQPAAQAAVPPRPKPAAGGSTLFERMTSLSRPRPGAAEPAGEDDDGDAGSISIPRFLGRQNNQ